MADKEKVIKGLALHGDFNAKCDDCSYRNEESPGEGCVYELCNDAIALLKEQEEKIRQLRLALQILNGNGIKVDTEGR